MREMRLYKKEVKETSALESIIQSCEVVRIGCMDEEGMFIVPMNFGYEYEDRNLRLYIHSASTGRKAEAFDLEPDVAIEMDCQDQLIEADYTCNYSMAYRSIMGNGRVRKISDLEEKARALRMIVDKLKPETEISFREEQLNAVSVYCIEVGYFTGKQRKPK